jgi:type IX secretion system PorP/SprF family membrane protein
MKKLLFTCLIIGSSWSIYGQSIINKNLYTTNPAQINPAYMGNQGRLFLGFQSSLVGSNKLDLPTYSSINAHASLFENFGLGANFLSETQGAFSLTMADVGSSYKVFLQENQSLRFGLSFGFIRRTLNPSTFTTNAFVDQNDPFLIGDFYDQTRMKIGAGFIYQIMNFELAVGSPYLFTGGESLNKEANVLLGYTWAINNGKLKVNPSFFYQFKNEDFNLYDFNLKGTFSDLFWLQAGYRSNQSINVGFGLSDRFFDIGYNFNMAMGDLKMINANNHEILLAFTIKNKDKRPSSRGNYRPYNQLRIK